MMVLEKYLTGKKLTGDEKRELLFCIIYALGVNNTVHFDIIEDWFSDSISKINEDLLKFASDYRYGALKSFISIIEAEDDFEVFYHEDLFGFYGFFNTKRELLSLLKITPRKIDDLLVSISFNLDINDYLNNHSLEQSKVSFDDDRLLLKLKQARLDIDILVNG